MIESSLLIMMIKDSSISRKYYFNYNPDEDLFIIGPNCYNYKTCFIFLNKSKMAGFLSNFSLYSKPKLTLQFLSLNILFLYRFDKNKIFQLASKTCPNRLQERLFMQVIPLSSYLC